MTVQSKLPRDQYLYLFDLEPDRFSVTPLTPPGARDVVTRRHPMVQYTGITGVAGDAQLLLLATDAYIDLSALAQDGLARDIDPLARLLEAASNGTRAIDPPAVVCRQDVPPSRWTSHHRSIPSACNAATSGRTRARSSAL